MKKYLAIALFGLACNAQAGLITSIDEATVANGDHTHSDNGGRAAVGYWNSEESRAVVEFNTASILGDSDAKLLFDLTDPTGLYYGHDQNYLGDFNVYAFVGNGTVTISDYNLTTTLLGSFSASGMAVGDSISVDISSLISGYSDNFLGFVFDPTSANPGDIRQETMFNNFRITTRAQVPEPTSLALLVLGMMGVGLARRKIRN